MITDEFKSIVANIILYSIAFVFFLFVINRKKIYRKIEPFVERYIYKYIPEILLYPFFIFIPLIGINLIPNIDNGNDQFYISAIIIYLLFVVVVIFGLIEKFGQYVSESLTFPKLIWHIIISLFSIVLCFGFTFNALFFFDKTMFNNVSENGCFEEALQFVYYSFGLLFSVDICDIKATSLVSQGVVALEALASFLVLVILLANYENIGRIFNQKNSIQREQKQEYPNTEKERKS